MPIPLDHWNVLASFVDSLPPGTKEISESDLESETGIAADQWHAYRNELNPLLRFFLSGAPEIHVKFLEEVKARHDPHPPIPDLSEEEARRLVAARAVALIDQNQEFTADGIAGSTGVPLHHVRPMLDDIVFETDERLRRTGSSEFYAWTRDASDYLRAIAEPLRGDDHESDDFHETTDPDRPLTVFFSWQSDLPNKTNRTLIGDALERAARALHGDGVVDVLPLVERDTRGLPGSPDICDAILQKIDTCDIFVADLSLIGEAGGRPTPNPNVLFEAGYALHALGWENVIFVMNTATGSPEQLPFDLRQRRICGYQLTADEAPAPARTALSKTLTVALREVVSRTHPAM